eukprot:m51a1_g3632 hypothetical protein (154) ;mRNA; f:139091-139653
MLSVLVALLVTLAAAGSSPLNLEGSYTIANPACEGASTSSVFSKTYQVTEMAPEGYLLVEATTYATHYLTLFGGHVGAAVKLQSEFMVCRGRVAGTQFAVNCSDRKSGTVKCSAVFVCTGGRCIMDKDTDDAAGPVAPALAALAIPVAALLRL